MQSWVAQELRYARLPDARLHKRLVRLVEACSARPEASLPQACGSWAATKAAYSFWSSERVSPEAIRAAHELSTQERVRGQGRILAIQDTTDLNFTQRKSTQGLGPLDHPAQRGLKVHSVLATTVEGVPLGLLHQQVWARDPDELGQKHRRRQRPTQEKESQRWLTALAASQASVPEAVEVITVADREADIYDLFALPRRPGSQLLIRATHNRRVDHEARYLHSSLEQTPVSGEMTVSVPRQEQRAERQAKLSLRWVSLSIQPPRHHRQPSTLSPVRLQVVLAEEESPPPEVAPIRWLLVTTLPVHSLAEAVQCVRWYHLRWLIERYHYVLKSGCQLEKLQLETAERLERALATYCIVAWRLLWLTYQARQHPESACDAVLESHEWQALYGAIHQTTTPPQTVPTLHQAVAWLAQLGGFLGRKRDGEPGVKTIWRGLRRLHDIAATWQLLRPSSASPPDSTLMGNA